MNAHNEQHDPTCIAAYEQLFQADSRDPSQTERLAVWAMSWNAARAAEPSPVVKQNLTTQPAAAQEAVAWQINATSSNRGWENCTQECYDETLRTGRYMGLPSGAKDVQVRALYAAPVTAVPVDCQDSVEDRLAQAIDERDSAEGALGAMFRAVTGRDPEWSSAWGFGDAIEEAEEHVAALEHKAASTPAAPGIDLRQLLAGFDVEVLQNPLQPPATYLEEVRLSLEFQPGGGHKVADAIRAALIEASPKGGSDAQTPRGLKLPNLPFAVFDEFGVGADDRIADYGLACAKAAMQAASAQAQTGDAPTYTTGHCENHKKPGGCPLHNLQCGYPRCDRRQAGDAEVQP